MEGIPDQIPESTYERWDTYGRIVTASPSAPSKHPQEYAYIPTYNWLRVTTYEIHQTDQDSWDIEPWGEADFYPKIRVNGQYYYEDPIMDQDHAYLQWVIADQYVHPWFTLVPFQKIRIGLGSAMKCMTMMA